VRRHLSIVLIGLLVFLTCGGRTLARAAEHDAVPPVEKIKAKITKLGVGEKARAQITLRTGEKIKGYVSSAGENEFAFTEGKSGQTRSFAYSDVVEVKKPGGLSTAAKIGIGVGIGAAVLAIVAIHVKNHLLDDFRLGPN